MTKKNTTTATRHTAEQSRTEKLYTTAERAVYIALRARHEKSGQNFLAELQNAWSNDEQARKGKAIAEQISTLEKAHASHRKGAEHFQTIANRLTVDEIERATAQTLADDFRAKARQEQNDIETLYKTLAVTFSDRADLTHTAIIQILQNEKTPQEIKQNTLAKYGKKTVKELTRAERKQAQEQANFRAVINAVGKAINKLASPEVMNGTKTKAVKITTEQAQQWYNTYSTEETAKEYTKGGYITVEHRNTKTQNGFYKVYHNKTVGQYLYIEQYTAENGEILIDGYEKSYNPFVSNRADLEQLADLYERAELTDRQRLFLKYFCMKARHTADFTACKKYAFSKVGLTTRTAQDTFFHRLKIALVKGYKADK